MSAVGTSPFACSDLYHGDGPASEPETQAVQNEWHRLAPNLIAAASLHSFGNYWLMPFGSEVDGECEHMPEPDDTISVSYFMNATVSAFCSLYGT